MDNRPTNVAIIIEEGSVQVKLTKASTTDEFAGSSDRVESGGDKLLEIVSEGRLLCLSRHRQILRSIHESDSRDLELPLSIIADEAYRAGQRSRESEE